MTALSEYQAAQKRQREEAIAQVALAEAPSTAPEPPKPASVQEPAPQAPVAPALAQQPTPQRQPAPGPMMQAALAFQAQGLPPIPIKPGTKQPAIENWQNRALTVEEFGQYWGGSKPCGIALPLGARSKGRIDLDLDRPEARALADELGFIYDKYLAFGRKSTPRAHRVATCEESMNLDQCKTIAFAIPAAVAKKLGLGNEEHAASILELRGNNGYTIFPPSLHQGGERIEWDNAVGREVPKVPYAVFRADAGLLAFLAFMARFYPPVGIRNDFNLALGGALLRALAGSYGEDEALLIEHVDRIVTTVCRVAGDQGRGPSWERRAGVTWTKIKGGVPATGLTKLLEILGLPEMESKLREWLGADADDRPVITYDETDMSGLLAHIQDAIMARGTLLFQRGNKLVNIYRTAEPQPDGAHRAEGSLIIGEVGRNRVVPYITDAARFKKWVKFPKPHWAETVPSERVCNIILSWNDNWKFPALVSVCSTPTMRRDGTVIEDEGYDSTTGSYLDFGGVKFQKIAERPSRDDALAALARIKRPLTGFPFVPDDENEAPGPNAQSASRSVALSGFLTPPVRAILRTSPLHGLSAAVAGTGKSLLADGIALAATGKPAAALTLKNEEEDAKQLAGILMAGDAVCNIDNVTKPIGGAMWCSVLTQETVQIRVLGRTGQVTLPSRTFYMATGKNIIYLEDLSRRVLHSRLDARMERPETRKFDGDFKTDILRMRPQLVVDALTVLRAYVVAGRPGANDLEPFGSFEDWSALVRGAIVWLGEPDPCATRAAIATTDPVRADLASLMAAVRDGAPFGLGVGKPFRSLELVALGADPGHGDLKAALEGLFPRGITAKGLTGYLRKHADEIVSGHFFRATYDAHAESWNFVLREVPPAQGEML